MSSVTATLRPLIAICITGSLLWRMLPLEVYALAWMGPNLSWTFSPLVIVPLSLLGAAYARRWRRVRGGAPARRARDAPVWRLCCFIGSLACVLAALVSPLDALAEQLLAMHMLQHVLLLDLAPILAI